MPTVSVPEPTPEVGETVSHGLPEVADQARVPPPALVKLAVWEAGVLPPRVYEKLILADESDIEGGCVAVTVSTTATVCGLFAAPGAVTVIVPL